ADFNCEDYGFDVDGIVGVYTCCNCSTTHYIIDAFLGDSQPRIIKYEILEENNDAHLDLSKDISNCLLCSSKLNIISTKQIKGNDILILNSNVETCNTIKYKCNSCKTIYICVDIDYYNESSLATDSESIFYNRNIYINDLPNEIKNIK
ncbi:MAG: hypothetical protein IJH34_18155, partial [Romboutsia sp.]|nr:hypothetical protein [Romboutsia sp.]